MKLSVVIPARNEAENIEACLEELGAALRGNQIAHEVIVIDDNSTDETAAVVRERAALDPAIRLVDRRPPPGFGRAIRAGLEAVEGDAIVIYMADRSDHPEDAVAYFRKIEEGYDCVFGSRFVPGSVVEGYPRGKRVANRLANRLIQLMFWMPYNDITNAFKAYRTDVVRECGPFHASHFNVTVEMALGALIRRYAIAQIPIRWSGRTWGSSKLKIREMGRQYLCTVLKAFFERMLIVDDLLAERLEHESQVGGDSPHLQDARIGARGLSRPTHPL